MKPRSAALEVTQVRHLPLANRQDSDAIAIPTKNGSIISGAKAFMQTSRLASHWLVFLFIASTGFSSVALAGEYRIEVGSGDSYPGETQVVMPLYISTSTAVDTWQIHVDFDGGVLSLADVIFTDTVSEDLGPTLNLALPDEVTVEYASSTPLPAGVDQLVAFLVFDIVPTAIPDTGNGTVETTVNPAGVESHPLEFELSGGGTVTPIPSGGSAVIYYGFVVQLDPAVGSYYDAVNGHPARVGVRVWSDGPIQANFYVGLDYVDLFLSEADTEDSATAGLGPDSSVTLVVAPADGSGPARWILRLDLGGGDTIPPLDGEILAHLDFTPQSAVHGTVPLTLLPDFCVADGEDIGNLLPGEITLEDAFVRGDTNFDATTNLADALAVVGYTFLGGSLLCRDAADVNDDGAIDPADPIYLLSYVFMAGPPPAAPFPSAGTDASGDALGCLPALP